MTVKFAILKPALLGLALLFHSTILHAQKPATSAIELAIKKLEVDAAMKHGSFSVIAHNLDNGKVLVDHHGSRSMIPASIQKLLTTGIAIEKLGPSFQFETKLAAHIDPGTKAIGSTIYVFPSGDPTLQSRYYQSQPSSIERIKNMLSNFSGFDGTLSIDASLYNQFNTPRGWIWEDMGNYFGTTPTPLMWRDNSLHVYFNSAQPGAAALLSNNTQGLNEFDFVNQVVAAEGNRDDAWFFSAPNTSLIYAKGSIPAHRTDFLVKAAHPKPMESFGEEVLREMKWTKAKVEIETQHVKHSGLTTIGTLLSPPLESIAKLCNSRSLNHYAEALCITLDPTPLGKSIEGGTESIVAFLKAQKISTSGMRLIDGSGLSPLNRMTGHQMIGFLTLMHRSANRDAFVNSLSVAGQSGTLASSFKTPALKGMIKGKSGTMQGVRNYAGYLTNARGETIAFCIMLQDYDEDRRAAVMTRLEELLEAMHSF